MSAGMRLGLGTVQWGMPYGIANRRGRPAHIEVGEMLRLGSEHGVTLLDTAHVYGEAEGLIGAHDAAALGFHIVTKTTPLRSVKITEEDVLDMSAAFARSLALLGCDHVYGLLVHHSGALLADGGEYIWAALEAFKADGRAGRIGASVYDPEQLDLLLDRYQLDLVQLPLSIYDQRFERCGLLARLQERHVEVHARSVFLQGLLLMSADQLPERFSALRRHHVRLHNWFRECGLTPLEGCLRFALQQPGVDRVIVGCETAKQLEAIVEASATTSAVDLTGLREFEVLDRSTIDPATWLQ